MISNLFKHRRAVGWVVVAIAILGTYNFSLALRRRGLRESVAEALENHAKLKAELQESEKVQVFSWGISNGTSGYDSAMRAMLTQCQSREDFVVREGPRIVWSELSSSTETLRRIGVYVPAGKHRLKYSTFSNHITLNTGPSKVIPNKNTNKRALEDPAALAREQFVRGDARQIANAVNWELIAVPDVYEIQLQSANDGPVRISVIGPDNVLLHEQTLDMIAGPCTFHSTIPIDSFAFPSELKPDDNERPYFVECKSLPVIDLGLFYVKQCDPTPHPRLSIDLRLWIESDSPACLPAIYLATNYDKVALLRYRLENPPLTERVSDSDTEIARLFEPYDGSDRVYFREEIFARPPAASSE